jgi:uncharacterized membrane protein YqhA
MGRAEVLNYLKQHDYFPNTSIAYRIWLIIPVIIALVVCYYLLLDSVFYGS